MGERFTRWGKRPEEPKARTLSRATFEAPILSDEVPALPFVQTRAFNRAASVEKRATGAAGRMVVGRIPYNEVIQTIDGYGELLKPGCFAASIAADDPRVLTTYNPERVLGRMSNGTCQVWEQSDGLYFEAEAPATSWADDLIISMLRGDIDQASIAFYVMAFDWVELGGKKCRAITRAKLLAASVESFSSMQGAQAETSQAIANARAEGYQAGRRASIASNPKARVATNAKTVRAQIERKNNV